MFLLLVICFVFLGWKKNQRQTTNIQNAPHASPNAAKQGFLSFFFEVQVSCVEEWQWLICSPCMQLALTEQLADAE